MTPIELQDLATDARADRDNLIKQTDWTQLPDVPEQIKSKYTEYRQALRDIPQQEGFPESITWPEKP